MGMFPHVRYFERGILFPLGMSQHPFLLPHILPHVRILLFPHFQYFWHLSSCLTCCWQVVFPQVMAHPLLSFHPLLYLFLVPGTVFDLGTDTVDGLDTGRDCIDWYAVVGLVCPPAATGTITKSGTAI